MDSRSLPRFEHACNSLHATFSSEPAQIAPVRTAVEQFAAGAGFDEAAVGEIGLVVNEAVANIIRHAYGGKTDQPIELDVKVAGDAITMSLRDWGSGEHPVRPEQVAAAKDPLKPGGLGLICMRKLMDHVVFTPQDRGMLLTMRRTRRR